MAELNNIEFLTTGDVLKRVPVSPATFQRWIKSGRFPAPVQLARRNYWPRRVVDAWIEREIAQRIAC